MLPGGALTHVEVRVTVLKAGVGGVVDVVIVGEDGLVLVVVDGVRVCVTDIDAKCAGHATGKADDRRLIAGIGLAGDVSDGAVGGMEALVEEVSGVSAALDGAEVLRVFDGVVEHAERVEIDIGVDEVGQLARVGAQIGDGESGATAKLLLQRKLGLIDLRILEVPVEVDSVGLDQEIGIARKNIREGWRAGVERAEIVTALCGRCSGGGERAVNRRVRDPAIVDAVSAAENRAAGAEDVPGKTGARTEVVAVVRHDGGLGNVGIGEELGGVGQVFVFVADAERKSEAPGERPVVGDKGGVIGGFEGPGGLADGLFVIRVAGIEPGASGGAVAVVGRDQVGDEVEDAGVGVGSGLVVQAADGVGDVVVVVSELDGVLVVNPGDGVDELLARLVGILRLVERRARAKGESRAAVDGDLRGKAEAVVGKLLLKESGGAGKLGDQFAAVLISRAVEQVRGGEIFPAGNGGIGVSSAGAEASSAVCVRGLRGRAVQRSAAHEVVLRDDMITIVGPPVDLGKEDNLASGARHIAKLGVEVSDSGVPGDERLGWALSHPTRERLKRLRGRGSKECLRLVGAGNAREVSLVLLVGEEPEELVVANRTSGGGAPLHAVVGGLVRNTDILAKRVALGERGVCVGRAPGCVSIVERCLPMQAVGTASGDAINDASGCVSIFRREVRGIHLELVDRRLGRGVAVAAAAALAS